MRARQPWRTNRSRVLRANETSAEARLWAELKDRRLGGLKFVRQAPIENYYVDFLCRERKIIVEIDGGTHSTIAELSNDATRSDELRRLGYRVWRISNADVFANIDGVLDHLLAFARAEE